MSPRRRDRPFDPSHQNRPAHPSHHDPYRARRKLHDPTGCPECGACFRDGRWSWHKAPADAPRELCPACRRIRDDYPAGIVTFEGGFLGEHLDEIRRLVRHTEEAERGLHPLKRILSEETREDALEVRTTDADLAQAIGRAVERAYQGKLEIQRSEDVLRATWRR